MVTTPNVPNAGTTPAPGASNGDDGGQPKLSGSSSSSTSLTVPLAVTSTSAPPPVRSSTPGAESSTPGAAATPSPTASAAPSSNTTSVTFENFPNPDHYYYVGANQSLTWTTPDNITIQDLVWIVNFNTTTQKNVTLSKTSTNASDGVFSNVDFSDGTASLPMDDPLLVDNLSSHMTVWMDWIDSQGGSSGYCFCPLFTVINQSDPHPRLSSFDHDYGAHGTCLVTSSAARATSAPQTTSAASTSTSAASKSSGGGLSSGAIAGIVVGVVVGLALIIGAVVLCLLRRRRRRGASGSSYATEQQTSEAFISDKAMHERTGESAHTLYSDDGAARGLQQEHVQDHELSEYDGGPAQHQSDTVGYDATTGSTHDLGSDQQGMSRSVAHLVEEGMTRDDIRRLEEEERHLDAEIERAGRQ